MIQRDHNPESSLPDVLERAVEAADLLAESCISEVGSDRPKPGTVRDLARALAGALERVSAEASGSDSEITSVLAAEAALLCADLATLTVCNIEDLTDSEVARRVIRSASEVVGELSDLASEVGDSEGTPGYLRDLRSASWKISLARHQL